MLCPFNSTVAAAYILVGPLPSWQGAVCYKIGSVLFGFSQQ